MSVDIYVDVSENAYFREVFYITATYKQERRNRYICSQVLTKHTMTSQVAEVKAIGLGLWVARRHNLEEVVIHCDCKEAVERMELIGPYTTDKLIDLACKHNHDKVIKYNQKYKLRFVPRELNRNAHKIVRKSRKKI